MHLHWSAARVARTLHAHARTSAGIAWAWTWTRSLKLVLPFGQPAAAQWRVWRRRTLLAGRAVSFPSLVVVVYSCCSVWGQRMTNTTICLKVKPCPALFVLFGNCADERIPLCSCPHRWFRRWKIQSPLSIYSKRVQFRIKVDNRSGVCHQEYSSRQQNDQGTNLGHW